MSVIRVDPASVQAYASFAQQRLEAIRGDLEVLVRDVVTVRYFGPNAAMFKTRCGELASEFSRSLLTDLGRIAEVVRASTSNISAALGGAAIVIGVNGSPVPVPAVDAGDGSVDVDTSALEALKPLVGARFGSLQDALSAHLNRLQATDWEGAAKRSAVEQVSGFTSGARSRAQEAQISINATIDHQIRSVLAADR